MPSQTYCRYENAKIDMEQILELWEEEPDNELNSYELPAKKRLEEIVMELAIYICYSRQQYDLAQELERQKTKYT